MRLFIIILALLLTQAKAEDIYHNPPSEEGAWPYVQDLPRCEDEYVLRKIMYDFEKREREYWSSNLYINKFIKIEETGVRSNGLSYTPRRYCKSEAVFSDALKRIVYFNITPDQSVILSGQVIDWCINGLDREHVDGPNCQRVTNSVH